MAVSEKITEKGQSVAASVRDILEAVRFGGNMEKEKNRKTIRKILIAVGVIAAAAGVIYCLYRYLKPDYLDDLYDDDGETSDGDASDGEADAASDSEDD